MQACGLQVLINFYNQHELDSFMRFPNTEKKG